jgi:hypothetical protein
MSEPPAWLADLRAAALRAKAAEIPSLRNPNDKGAGETARRSLAAMHDRLDPQAVLWILEVLEGAVMGTQNTLLKRDYATGPAGSRDKDATIVDNS